MATGVTHEQMLEFNTKVIEEFRANGGRCGGYLEGNPLLLLTMTGAKTGRTRTTPLTYHADGDGWVVMASAGGSPKAPAWYHNLMAQPRVEVEVGTEKVAAIATEAQGAERQRLYDAMTGALPRFAEYQEKVERTIPVVVLRRA